jgi:hypothetical protein
MEICAVCVANKRETVCFLLTPVNMTEYYDSMTLMRRQDKNIILDWEVVMHDTDKTENVLLFDNVYGSDIQKTNGLYILSTLLQKI